MNDQNAHPLSGAEIMSQFVPSSPFNKLLGFKIAEIQPGMATLALPFTEDLVTAGTIVHGGAIASLIDVAAAVAAWSDAEVPANLRGVTVNLTVTYLAAANQEDLLATAHVLRRGRSLVYLDVDVRGSTGQAVARGLVTYKIG
ncbi:MAG TPA: PaaI family thioesterase [Ktedonobacteraceae bacterium]|nr:PaaI family thioesterase [Ktedonobacteraceae bacterium]